MATEDVKYTLYDTAIFGAAAGEINLFQVRENQDATHGETITNMCGPGFLPLGEKFTINQIDVFPETVLAEADLWSFLLLSLFELRVSDKTRLKVPLLMVVGRAGWGGADATTAAAAQAHVGPIGNGYSLQEIPIAIEGGEPFRVRIWQGTATAAARNIKVCL